MARDQTPPTHGASRFKPLFACAAAIAALGWFWTVGTFLLSVHMVYEYIVTSSIEGLTECFKPLLTIVHPELFWVAIPAIGVGVSAYVVFIHGKTPLRSTIPYCLGFLVTPGLEFIRQSAWPIPHTFLEPFLFAILTGMLMKELLQIKLPPAQTFFNPAKHGWFVLVVLASIALASWWFWQSHRAYEDYQLGYFDFGHFARRVINTWRGVGFLQQTPGLPPFWDHFNPALVTLAPLWGLWSDAHLFFALQAVSLAVGSLFVYGIARRLGTSSAGSAAWAGAYLCYPVVGQLNLNFSYGWHPVTIAIPLILAAFYALTCRRPVVALLLAAFACSWKEDVLTTVSFLCFGLALLSWQERRRASRTEISPDKPHDANHAERRALLATESNSFDWLLRPRTFFIAGLFFLAATVTVFTTVGFAKFQVGRFDALGNSIWEIVLSPFLRPKAFWGEVLSTKSFYYLMALFLPFGLRNALRGWPVLIGLALPLAIILAWNAGGAKCIAFQYVTCLVFVIVPAAMVGCARRARKSPNPAGMMTTAGVVAMATSLCLSFPFGGMPFTPPTSPFYTHESMRDTRDFHVKAINEAVALANHPDAAVMATGRVAAHLLTVRRLEQLSDSIVRKDLLAKEAGEGKSWIEAFDWLVLDKLDTTMPQGIEVINNTIALAKAKGYRRVFDKDGIIVLRRPRSH